MNTSIEGCKNGRYAEVCCVEGELYIKAHGKVLQVAPEEIYDMVTLYMSAYFQDFSVKELQ